MEYQYILNVKYLCLYSCVIYPTCKTNTPHYMAICDLTGCTTLSHKPHDFRKNKSTNYVLIFCTSWSETLQEHSAAHCHKCTVVFLKSSLILWVFNSSWIFYIDLRKLHKNPKWWTAKIWSRFILTGRKDMKKPVFVSINFAFAPKRYIHITSYTTSLQILLEILAVHQTRKNFLSC